jgi:hypothetical protein
MKLILKRSGMISCLLICGGIVALGIIIARKSEITSPSKDVVTLRWARAMFELATDVNAQRQRFDDQENQLALLRDRYGIVDTAPEADTSIISTRLGEIEYSVAKAGYLQERRILEAGKRKLKAETAGAFER